MRILIITQAIDRNDPILGFFHEWVIGFSKEYKAIDVMCLYKGDYSLPSNVNVFSLGKETGASKLKYLYRFFTYIFSKKNNYDAVFVHMNEEYVVLGGLFWRLFGKKIVLWRNHKQGTWKTRIAVFLSHVVLCTSSSSFTARFKKTKVMPVGVSESLFHPMTVPRNQFAVLSVGRISRVKKIEIIIEAFALAYAENAQLTLDIYGPVLDQAYFDELQELIKQQHIEHVVQFKGSLQPQDLARVYSSYGMFVNTTDSGSFDKTILEASFCEMIPITSNRNVESVISEEYRRYVFFTENDAEILAQTLGRTSSLSADEYQLIARTIAEQARRTHSLATLIANIKTIL